jgi:hypothetical protein
MQDQLSARVMILPVICASNKTHLTNFSDNQHTWLLFLTFGNIQKDIRSTATNNIWMFLALIPFR